MEDDPNADRRKKRKTSKRFSRPRFSSIKLEYPDGSPAYTSITSPIGYYKKQKPKQENQPKRPSFKAPRKNKMDKPLPNTTCDEIRFRQCINRTDIVGESLRKTLKAEIIRNAKNPALVTEYKEGIRFMKSVEIKHDLEIEEEYNEDRQFWLKRSTKLILSHFEIEKWGFNKELNLRAVIYEIEEKDEKIYLHFAIETFWKYFYRATYILSK